MQVLFKDVSIDLVSTFHAKSFFLYDIILLTDKHDDLFTINDKPYVNKDKDLASFIQNIYKGDWDGLFLDLYSFKPNAEGRLLSLFLSDRDYVTFLGKFVSSLFPEMSLEHKCRIVQAVCDDTKYVKSGVFTDRAKAYLSFSPTKEEIVEAASQTPCNLPMGFSDSLRFDWTIGHHWNDPTRFFQKILKNVRSLCYQEFRALVFKDLPDSRGIFAFSTDRSVQEAMSDPLIAPSFDDSFDSKTYYADPEGSDVKAFVSKYGVDWIVELSKKMIVGADYLRQFPVDKMIDPAEMVAIVESPDKMENWFRRLVINSSFRQSLDFPLLSEWVRLKREGVLVKIV